MASNELTPLGAPAGDAAALRKLPSFRVGGHRVVAGSRRGKLPSVRLGGRTGRAAPAAPRRRRWWQGGVRVLTGALRRVRARRLRWLRLQCARAARAARSFYWGLLRDLAEAGASPAAAEARAIVETYFAMPIMPYSAAALSAGLR